MKRRHRDLRAGDVVIAVAVALGVMSIAGVALSAPGFDAGDGRPIDLGAEVPISVTPVLDSARGGSKAKRGPAPAVPKSWRRKAAPPPPTKPPPPPRPKPDAAPEPVLPAEPLPPPPDAPEEPDEPPEDPVEPPDPEELPGVVDDPPPDEPPEEAPSADAEPGAGGDAPADPDAAADGGAQAGGGGSELGPLAVRAIASYRQRLIRWLSSRFRITGTGLSTAELLKYKVRATIHIGDDRMVSRYSIKPSGNAVFDRAAKEALDSVVGEQVPPPPDGYPGALQPTVRMTFVCKESTCN